MSKESKLEEIMDELECNDIIGKKILDISEDLQNDDYSYCQKIYEISKELDNEDYSKCKNILEISEDGEYDIDDLISLMNYADEIGKEFNIDNIDEINYKYYINSDYGIDNKDLLENLWNSDQNFDDVCNIIKMSKELDNEDYYALKKLLELKNEYGIDDNRILEIFSDIIKETGCDVTDAFNIYYISCEIMDNSYNYIYTKLLPIYNELECDFDKLEDIYSVSSAIDSEDYEYCEEIYNYMKSNNIDDAQEAEKSYKLEQEQN